MKHTDLVVKGTQRKALSNCTFKSTAELEKKRTIRAVAASGKSDRTGDIVDISGIQLANFQANPIILWAHDHYAPPIGKALSVGMTAEGLVIEIQFATKAEFAFADTVYQLTKGGFINALSIGAQVLEAEWIIDNDERIVGRLFKKLDLLEVSVVPVPADAKALITAVKSQGAYSYDAAQYLLRAVEEPLDLEAINELHNKEEYVSKLWKGFIEPKVDNVDEEGCQNGEEAEVTKEQLDALLKRLEDLEAKVAEQKQLGEAAQKFVTMMEMTVKALLTQAVGKGLNPKTMMETVKTVAAGQLDEATTKSMLATVESLLGAFNTSGK